jgi:hypothetical protein
VEDDDDFKYNPNAEREDYAPERNWLATAVGTVLTACICALAIAGTIALIKWMMGV